eukprot:XP_003545426.2 rop guanine nucleotide exchange factor 2 [Glycine max]
MLTVNMTPMKHGASQAVISMLGVKQHRHSVDEKSDDLDLLETELDMMRERFSKLLLGEDMSGVGKGVCTAVTISNSITNLYDNFFNTTAFGQNLKLEPLKPEKKAMWRREMNCLLSVCDYILEFSPTAQYLEDGTIVEMMTSKPRSDIYINLPALQKLDTMLIEILDSFQDTKFWYAEQGTISRNSTRSRGGSFRRIVQRKDEKWWLPVPCVHLGGLIDKSRKHLNEKRDCANQIHKAAMAINSSALAEMDIPETYMSNLPKSGRTSLGDTIYRYMYFADKFSPDHLLDCLKISSEHEALELADKVESSMFTWRRKACLSHSKTSWNKVKDLMADTDQSEKICISCFLLPEQFQHSAAEFSSQDSAAVNSADCRKVEIADSAAATASNPCYDNSEKGYSLACAVPPQDETPDEVTGVRANATGHSEVTVDMWFKRNREAGAQARVFMN